MKYWITFSWLLIMTQVLQANDTVVLLHGLMRQPASMAKMADALEEEGYQVHNLGYPSRKKSIEELAVIVRQAIVKRTNATDKIHFVTHSLGGILVRQIQKTDPLPNIGRVVMLAPPNQGSEIVNKIGHWKAFTWANGPVGIQLGTENDGLIAQLGPVDFECGIITGDRSINWINSCMIAGSDDGKVSTQRAKVAGMSAYKVMHTTHPFIMKKKAVIQTTIRYLKTGKFDAQSDGVPHF